MIDNASLLIGIAFSSGSLMIALLIGWLGSRTESYLIHGACGIALVMIGVAIMGIRADRYDLFTNLLPFSLILLGFTGIYAGSRLFRNWDVDIRPALMLGIVGLVSMSAAFIAGYSGVGTILLNFWAGTIMLLCAREYWLAREGVVVAMIANALLYTVTAASFLACAAVLVVEQQWVLTAPAKNWAEDFNSIMSLVGLTGIGAITLTVHHARTARRHEHEAATDSLTGVLNRRALFVRFPDTQLVPHLPVVMFDLDHFKQINDKRGHGYGDMVLQRFADLLRAEARPVDVLARLGGEEFCMIMPGLDAESARATAERIRTGLTDLALSNGDEDHIVTVSAGLAIGGAEESFSALLSRADAALYKAKRAGRNRIHLASPRLVA